jgi:hypothetical protein
MVVVMVMGPLCSLDVPRNVPRDVPSRKKNPPFLAWLFLNVVWLRWLATVRTCLQRLSGDEVHD